MDLTDPASWLPRAGDKASRGREERSSSQQGEGKMSHSNSKWGGEGEIDSAEIKSAGC